MKFQWRAVVTTPQRARFVFVCVLALASLGVSCDPPASSSTSSGITREKAIEIARQETRLTREDVEAVQVTSDGKAVWRVTFKYRLPDQPPGLFETRIVELDARTGKVVGASIN